MYALEYRTRKNLGAIPLERQRVAWGVGGGGVWPLQFVYRPVYNAVLNVMPSSSIHYSNSQDLDLDVERVKYMCDDKIGCASFADTPRHA
jgi:hypothetical protein